MRQVVAVAANDVALSERVITTQCVWRNLLYL